MAGETSLRTPSYLSPMTLRHSALVAAAACAILAPLGCASTATDGPAASDRDLAELEALYAARKAADLDDVSEADVAFMTGMIAHHAQALVMSGYAPDNGASPAVRTLAARIINAQKDEIRNMQRWLADRGRTVPQVEGVDNIPSPHAEPGAAGHADHGGPGHGEHGSAGPGEMDHGGMDHGGMDHEGMPGMLSPAQLDELSRATGREFDRLFLTYMIQHHQGAVVMVRDLFATDGAVRDDTVFKIASEINVDQVTEIDRMQLMLNALPAGDGGSPLNRN